MAEPKTLVLENTTRRDALIAIEQKYQEIWEQEKPFEQNAPDVEGIETMSVEELHEKYPKFMGNMAFPYMNGVLHAGHAFTLSKAEFAVGYERMLGKRALFPFGFHCTGLPIKASADKLVREIELFGPNFDRVPAEAEEEKPKEAVVKAEKADPTKFKATKAKAVQKAGSAKYQFEIMLQLGIPREEVHKFADANYWIQYFPPKCEADCRLLGARVDWRRSFVTTDWNPYFDSFVRWQMNTLRAEGKIKFGKRYTIFSPKDNQPCMDHDRQSGEGVSPQEYVGIKIEVTEFPEAAKAVLPADVLNAKVFLVAATLRPETMYGQTCCFVSPKITYGVYPTLTAGEYIVTTERAYRNMCYQDLTPERGNWTSKAEINGEALIGAKIHAPLAQYPTLRVLPMDTILPTKGTGVVTCVPSDSPDDYITQMDLKKKAAYYKIDPEWVVDPVPVLSTPSYGDMTAKTLVEQLKINSPKDKELLAQAKELAYKEGFYQGTIAIGPYKGEKVEEAKPKIRDDLVKSGEAFIYSEPEGLVVSRSGDQCVVSLQDQWYTNYGEPTWRKLAEECLGQMNVYAPDVRTYFERTLAWFQAWALSRTYGLGSRIPWDKQYLVESLSDSTIYPAYYTIAHLLQGDVDGHKPGALGLKPEELTDSVFDYVFFRTNELPTDSSIPKEKLARMRREFKFFFPNDVRVSAKDLVPNHLTMYIYCNTAIFGREFWPKGIRSNGHLLLNNEKMSKSTGNFMTLREMLQKFGTDATRIALADAGDTTEDANFDEAVANAAILRLHNLKEWLEVVIADKDLRTAADKTDPTLALFDDAFEAEMDEIIRQTRAAYDGANYKLALKHGMFDLLIARDYYREVCGVLGSRMRKETVLRYAEVQILLLLPIAPHFAEWAWRELLKREGSVQNALFPEPRKAESQNSVLDAVTYVKDTSRAIREAEGQLLKKNKKAKVQFDPKKPSRLSIYLASSFPAWQDAYIELVRQQLESVDFRDMTGNFKKEVSKLGDPKRGMQLVSTLRQSILAAGDSSAEQKRVLDRNLTFDEVETARLVHNIWTKSSMAANVVETEIVLVGPEGGKNIITGEAVEVPSTKNAQDSTPGSPGIIIKNLE